LLSCKQVFVAVARRTQLVNTAHVPFADDKKLVEQLEIKLKEQGAELGNRDITIRALQRNFESLSSMCQEDQKKLKTTLDKLTKAQAELDKLTAERGDLDKQASDRLKKCQDALDAMSSKFGAADDELNKERKKSALLQKRLDDAERAAKDAEAAQAESKRLVHEKQRLQEDLQKMKARAEVRPAGHTIGRPTRPSCG
jgi:chromosome segregation ATPase